MSKNNNIIVFLGPPGSGKGSLSKLFVKRFGWSQLSTGNLCRQHISARTEIGKQIDFIIKSGKLISDSLVIDMVDHWMKNELNKPANIIFDGFPRTGAQAEAFYNLLFSNNFNRNNLKIVKMEIPHEALVSRLTNRFICQDNKCQAVYSLSENSCKPKVEFRCDECSNPLIRRSDDIEDSIKERLTIYNKHEEDILSFYKKIGHKVDHIKVEKPLEHVFEELLNILDVEDSK